MFWCRNEMTLIALLVITFCSGVCYGCLMEIVTNSESVQVSEGASVSRTCLFNANCPVDISIERKVHLTSESKPITHIDWINEGFLYNQTCGVSNSANGNYQCTMNISTFNAEYSDHYYCVIKEKGNRSNFKKDQLMFLTAYSHVEPVLPTDCFLPLVKSIAVQTVNHSNGSIEAILLWNVSSKESNNIDYCKKSNNWRVTFRSYGYVYATPGDREVRGSSDDWKKVPENNTSYKFTVLFNNSTYYQFLVGNQASKDMSRTFGSSIYYFGNQSPPVIKEAESQEVIRINQMDSREVTCTASGNPAPSVRWVAGRGQQMNQMQGDSSSTLKLSDVTANEGGPYLCIAQNVLVNPPSGRRTEYHVWQINVKVKEYNSSSNGVICDTTFIPSDSYCRNFLDSVSSIYTNVSVSKQSKEEMVGNAMTKIDQNIRANDSCNDLARSLLCHTIYPYCDVQQSSRPSARPICSRACEEFSSTKCSRYAAAIQRNEPQLYYLITSKCSNSSEGGQSPECVPISYYASRTDQTQPVVDTGSCVSGNGIGYSGNQVHTVSNRPCQLWSQQSPHKHPMLPALYPSELADAGYACRNPGGLGSRPWCYTTDPDIRWEYCDIPVCDSCEIYNGTMCSSVTGYDNSRVFIRRGRNINDWMDIEKKISDVFSMTRYHQRPTTGCENLLKTLLCHRAFPICNDDGVKELCTGHCRMQHSMQQLCPNVYREYQRFVNGHGNADFLSLVNCHSNQSSCTSSALLEIPYLSNEVNNSADSSTPNCYEGNGIHYRGNVSVSQGGMTCQTWDSNAHIVNYAHYPELASAANHCRNPGSLLSRPWCFTNSSAGWDYCNIPLCAQRPSLDEPYDASPSSVGKTVVDGGPRTALTALVYTFSILLAFFLIAIVCVAVIIGLIRRRRKTMRRENPLYKSFKGMKAESFVANSNYLTTTTTTSFSSHCEIPTNFRMLDAKKIKYVSQLGQGNFGIVFKGRAFSVFCDDEEVEVAVKTLKEEASSEVVQNFIDEAKLMFTFDHPNILQIYGVCMSEMPYQMVFEYMDEGDLTQFLRSRASSSQRRFLNPFGDRSRTESSYSNDPPSLNKSQLLSICTQIASGMKYLASVKHVHRDLACRNCLIKSDLTVKIGDFGMSRNLYSRDYYRVNGQAILPVRWMPPESLIYGKFSVEGDVWSFGVVMWEVFSFALQPYYGLSNEEVTEAIRHGKILLSPDDCPAEVYKVMKECWDMEPKDRPTFDELFIELSHLYQSDYDSDSDSLTYGSEESDAFYSEDNSLPEDEVSDEEEDTEKITN